LDSARIFTTAPSKPSPQTTLVLAAMGEAAASTEASLHDLRTTTEALIHELRASLDLLHGHVARIDTTQQQLLAQMGLVSVAVENSGKASEAVARQLAALENRIATSTHPWTASRAVLHHQRKMRQIPRWRLASARPRFVLLR
jgi:hypothetical protein